MSTRYRQTGSLQLPQRKTYSIWDSCSVSNWTLRATDTAMVVGQKKWMADYISPGFAKRRAKGEIFFSPMSSVEVIANSVPGAEQQVTRLSSPLNCGGTSRNYSIKQDPNTWEVTYLNKIGGSVLTGENRRPPAKSLFTDSELSGIITELSTAVLNERGRSDFNLWETLAESDKALGTLTGIFKSAYRTIRSRDLRGFTKEVSGGYLGYRYGLRPLVSDVNSVLEGLQKKAGRVRKSTRKSFSSSRYGTADLVYIDSVVTEVYRQQWWDTLGVRAMSLDEYQNSALNNLGLSSKGLLTLPWELTRYSFVYDWFANLGDFIGAMTPAFGWDNKGSCVTVNRGRTLVVNPTSSNGATGWVVDKPPTGTYTITQIDKSRNVGLHPGVVIRSDFRFSNLTRCLDAFSLLSQRVLNKR